MTLILVMSPTNLHREVCAGLPRAGWDIVRRTPKHASVLGNVGAELTSGEVGRVVMSGRGTVPCPTFITPVTMSPRWSCEPRFSGTFSLLSPAYKTHARLHFSDCSRRRFPPL